MLGLYCAVAVRGGSAPPGLIASLAESSKELSCPTAEFAPAPWVWTRHVYRRVTDAPADAVSSHPGQGEPVQVLLHGEVYNCDELAGELGGWPTERRGIAAGPDLAAAGIAARGIRFVEKLNGSFLLLAFFPGRNELVVANDRFGLRPHYWTRHKDCLLIAPSVRALLAATGHDHRIDRVALGQFFAFDIPVENGTLAEGIEVIPPAIIAPIRDAQPRFETYWDFPFPEPSEAPEADLIAELADRLARAVARRIEACVPLGLPLSGGMDSRVLAAGLLNCGADFKAFTFGQPTYIDRRLGKKVAAVLGKPYYTVCHMLSPDSPQVQAGIETTDGMSLFRHFHALQMFPLLGEHAGVVLDGLGGGTISGGLMAQPNDAATVDANFARWLLYHRFYSRVFYAADLAAMGLFPDADAAERSMLAPLAKRVAACRSPDRANCADYVCLTEWHRRCHLTGNVMLRTVVEVRAPLYDYDVIDWVMALPPRLRFDRHAFRMALARIAPELARIGTTPHGVPPIAEGLRRKTYILAVRGWRLGRRVVRRVAAPGKPVYPTVHVKLTDIPDFIEQRLSQAEQNSGRVIRLEFIRRLWREYRAGQADHDLKLSGWLTFDMWFSRHKDQFAG